MIKMMPLNNTECMIKMVPLNSMIEMMPLNNMVKMMPLNLKKSNIVCHMEHTLWSPSRDGWPSGILAELTV